MIKCPFCGCLKSISLETRTTQSRVRRRRKCKQCNKIYTTYEVYVPEGSSPVYSNYIRNNIGRKRCQE